MNLYERFESAAAEVRNQYPEFNKRAFVLGNQIQTLLGIQTADLTAYSSLPGLSELNMSGGGVTTFKDIPGTLIATEPQFENEDHLDDRLRASGIRVLQLLGIEEVIIIGVGSPLDLKDAGELFFWAEDHVNLSGINPLVGPNLDQIGERFPDMTAVYDESLTSEAVSVAKTEGFEVEKGVWVALNSDNEVSKEHSERFGDSFISYSSKEVICEVIASAHGNTTTALGLLLNPAEGAAKRLRKVLQGLVNQSN
ncbi:MAG: hypothetical protein IH825_04715 [Candidatus Marinimicrobia bacterium]|nr:hypothetical protein [Candidatus Neomarinimicrobiota bacterium]